MIRSRAHLHLLHRGRSKLRPASSITQNFLTSSGPLSPSQIRSRESLVVPFARLFYPLTNFCGWFAQSVARQLFVIDAWYLDVDINAVEQRSANTVLTAHHLRQRVGALFGGVAPIATRAGVHTIARTLCGGH